MYEWTQIDSIPQLFTPELFTQLHDNAGYIGELRVARELIEEAIPAEYEFTPASSMLLTELETAVNRMEQFLEYLTCDPADDPFTAIIWTEEIDPMVRINLWLSTLNKLYELERTRT